MRRWLIGRSIAKRSSPCSKPLTNSYSGRGASSRSSPPPSQRSKGPPPPVPLHPHPPILINLRLNRSLEGPIVILMKIYDFPMAPNPRRVRIFLAEKNIEMVYVHVDITKGENRTAAFIEKSPLGGLPVLEFDDGTYLTESVAICRYFEGISPEPRLMGGDPGDIASSRCG